MQSLEFIVNVSLRRKNTAQYFIFDFLKFRYGENYDWIYYNYFCELWFSCYYVAKKKKYGNVLNAEANVRLQVSSTAGVKLYP